MVINKVSESLGRWINITCLNGDVFSIREVMIPSMFRYPCQDPNVPKKCPYKIHHIISTPGKELMVSEDEWMKVAILLGMDTMELPEVKEGIIRGEDGLGIEIERIN